MRYLLGRISCVLALTWLMTIPAMSAEPIDFDKLFAELSKDAAKTEEVSIFVKRVEDDKGSGGLPETTPIDRFIRHPNW